jgi:surface antigen
MESMQITISEYNKLKPLLEFNGLKHGVELSGNHWISNKKEINPIKTELKDIEIE